MYDGDRGMICVFLKEFWVIVADEILKFFHVSMRTEFMWSGVNLRVPWCLIQVIIELTYKFLSFVFGPLLFGWSFR